VVVLEPGNEEIPGWEAAGGQFMPALQTAQGGMIPAQCWDWQEAPSSLDALQVGLAAAQSKTQP
jgi:hypothetical protein